MQIYFEGTAAATQILTLPANREYNRSRQAGRSSLTPLSRQEVLRSPEPAIPIWVVIALAAVFALIASLWTRDLAHEAWNRLANNQTPVIPLPAGSAEESSIIPGLCSYRPPPALPVMPGFLIPVL